jgi:hypothetical protein
MTTYVLYGHGAKLSDPDSFDPIVFDQFEQESVYDITASYYDNAIQVYIYVPQKPHKKHIAIILLKYTQFINAFVFK